MMPVEVKLTVTEGSLEGEEFAFSARTTCVAGRADDCHLRIVEQGSPIVSRHHCMFDLIPPRIRVRDYGSLNGTYVNGELIGQREPEQTPEEGAQLELRTCDLTDGDLVRLGDTVLRVTIVDPEPPKVGPGVCASCGRDVSGEPSGETLCTSCRRDPHRIVQRLLALADSGAEELAALRGYEIVRELGRGGMGAVYLLQAAGGQPTALKVMLPAVAVEERAKRYFLRETENTKALRHPNIVEFREGGSAEGIFYFTAEYCQGGSVDALMALGGGRLGIEQAGEIVLQALEGVAHAHEAQIPFVELADGSVGSGRGLVHRDLKPPNLFLSSSGPPGVVKVGDFGLAKAFDQAGLSGYTTPDMIGGTPQFMPREQLIHFRDAKPEVDVWAMAACLYNMLTGSVPRNFQNGVDPCLTVFGSDPVPIRERDPSIPKRVAGVIDEALVEEPEIQIKSARELKWALEAAL